MTFKNIRNYVCVCVFCIVGCRSEYISPIEKLGYVRSEEIEKEIFNDPCGSHYKWDWTKADAFDYAYISGKSDKINISSPFLTNASAYTNITNIIQARDYLPEQGWVLLSKVFGCPSNYAETNYPYFMLYNKYTGIIRLFVFNANPINYRKAAFVLSWEKGSDNNSMFAPSEVYRYSNEEYKANRHSGVIVNYIEDYYSHAWFVTEIPIGYDPGIDYTNNIVLRFKIENNTESTVKLNSEFSFETKTATANAQQVNSSDFGNGTYKFLEKGQKFLSKVPDVNKLDEYYEKINKGLDSTRYSGHSKLQKVVEKTRKIITGKDLRKILTFTSSVATSISGPLGAGISLFSSLFFKSNSQAMQLVQVMPTVSTGTGIISGEIFTTTNATSFPLQLPGSNHNYPNGEVNIDGLPVYDKPLGVISLERTPRLAQSSKVLDRDVIKPNYNERETDFDFSMKGYEYITYQLADYVNIALNTYSDAGIVDIRARLLAKHHLPYNLSDSRTRHITSKIEGGGI